MNRSHVFRILAIAGIITFSAERQEAAESRRLTLAEAVQLAIKQNHTLKIARLKVVDHESDQRIAYHRSAKYRRSSRDFR
jgi:hypothetical protein